MENFTQATKVFLITLILSATAIGVWGQSVKLISPMYFSAKNVPVGNEGWKIVDAAYGNAAADYWKMISNTSTITSPTIDFSKYTNLVIKVKVGSFGASTTTTTECNVKIESFDGTKWNEVITLEKPATSSANETSQSFTSSSSEGNIRFSTPNATGKIGARLFSVEITGDLITNDPMITASTTIELGSVVKDGKIDGTVKIKGLNLGGDLTVSTTAPFSTTISTIAEADAESAEGYQIPVKFSPTNKGTFSEALTISGGGLTSNVTITLTGTAYELKSIGNITDLRKEWTGTADAYTHYQLTSQSLVTFANSTNGYIQDENSGLLIYNTTSLFTSKNIQIGDIVSGLTGTLADYYGMLELVITDDLLSIESSGNEGNPIEITASDFATNFETYEGRLVKIQNLSFSSADGITNFGSSAKNISASCNDQTLTVRTFASRDYSNNPIPSKAHVTGIAVEYTTASGGTTLQLSPRMASDIVEATTSVIEKTNHNNLYIENGKLIFTGSVNGKIEIYSITGVLIKSFEVATNRIEIELPKGIYVVKTESGAERIAL